MFIIIIRNEIVKIKNQDNITNDDKFIFLYVESLNINEYKHGFDNDDVKNPIVGECKVCSIKLLKIIKE